MKPVNIDDYVRRYQAGEPAEQFARELGVKGDTVRGWLAAAGVQLRGRAEAKAARAIGADRLPEVVQRYRAGESENQLAKAFGVSRSVIRKRLVDAGEPARGRAAAERLKWSRMPPATRRQQTVAAQAARRGQTDSIEVRMRRAATCQARLSHAWPSEHALANALTATGAAVSQQTAVGIYNLDITFDGSTVAVEVESGNAFSRGRTPKTLKRLKHLVDSGWRVLIVFTKNRKFAFPQIVQKVLAWYEATGRNEPAGGQYGVVDGEGKSVAIPRCDFDGFARVPGF